MNAIVLARNAWETAGSTRNFLADLQEHLGSGVVVSKLDVFGMARPVRTDWPEQRLARIWDVSSTPDCWLVWSAAGKLTPLLDELPFELPYIAFHRGGARRRGPQPLKIYKLARVRALALRLQMSREGIFDVLKKRRKETT